MTNKESFTNIQNWMDEIIKYTGKDVVIVIGGNKVDLPERKVSQEDIDNFKKKKGLNLFEVSAKTGKGVEDAFKFIVETLIKKKNKETGTPDNNIDISKGNNNELSTTKGCCV